MTHVYESVAVCAPYAEVRRRLHEAAQGRERAVLPKKLRVSLPVIHRTHVAEFHYRRDLDELRFDERLLLIWRCNDLPSAAFFGALILRLDEQRRTVLEIRGQCVALRSLAERGLDLVSQHGAAVATAHALLERIAANLNARRA